MSNFPACLAFTLCEEGGFVDNPDDPGSATNKGITLATYRRYFTNATVADLAKLSDALAGMIYYGGYWKPVRGSELPLGVDLMVFDMAVNAGPERSIELLQRALDLVEDGIIGPQTMGAVSHFSLSGLWLTQKAYYRSLSGFGEFGRGWFARADRRYKAAVEMKTRPSS